MFPQNWEVSERIAVQFCYDSRDELSRIMTKRKIEIDVKLLLYAIQKTAAFENLLARRFTGITVDENINKQSVLHKPETTKEFLGNIKQEDGDIIASPFQGLIGKCVYRIFIHNSDPLFNNLKMKCTHLISNIFHSSSFSMLKILEQL